LQDGFIPTSKLKNQDYPEIMLNKGLKLFHTWRSHVSDSNLLFHLHLDSHILQHYELAYSKEQEVD